MKVTCKNLVVEIAKRNIKRNLIAQALGIHLNTLNNKLSGESQFSIEEAFAIKGIFFADLDLRYLFSEIPDDDQKAG